MAFQDFSIKRKLVMVILMTSLSVLALTCLALLTFEISNYRSATARSLSTIADVVAENSAVALIYEDQKFAGEIIAGLRVEPEIAAAALFNGEGRLYATYPKNFPANKLPSSPGPDGVTFHARSLEIYTPVVQGDKRVGTVYLQGDLQGTYHRVRVYGGTLLLIGVGSAIVALLLSNFFQRRISQPLRDLAKTAQIVTAQKDYSIRAAKTSNDELGDLTVAFNAMLDHIQVSHSALRESEERFRLLADNMKTTRDEALAASRAKDDFLAALSHELRTPLNPILLLASDAASNTRLPLDVRDSFETIRKNVELEARLIDDLLDLTSITRGKLVLDRQPVAVDRVIRDALATVGDEIRKKRITLTLDFEPLRPLLLADAVRLQQVFWNVFKNAVKFTPEGGKIAISTHLSEEGNDLTVEISDTGIGMNPGELSRVFAAFSQGDHAGPGGSHRFGGLGLGLVISRMLVELHSGRITASSAGRDLGSTFVIELPVHRGPASAKPEPSPERNAPVTFAPAEPARRARVLLVEDHAPTRIALEYLLVRRRYEVVSASCLAEARVVAARGDIDLLISDIGLPDGTGYELMTELRDRHGLTGIALSGYGMPSDVAYSRQVGFLEHLTKPVGVESLEKALASAFAAIASAARDGQTLR